MKAQLKNLKTFEGHEGIGFNAELYVNGKQTAQCHDGAYGGEVEFTVYDKDKFSELENYCKNLPHVKFDFSDDLFPVTVEDFVNGLVDKILKEKEQKKINNAMKKNILYGKKEGYSYKSVGWKVPLTQIPLKNLQGTVDNVKKQLKEGETIWNTNLEELGVKL